MTKSNKINQLKEELAQVKSNDAIRSQRIFDGDLELGDAYVSVSASSASIRLLETKIWLLENDGCEFDVLLDTTSGEVVSDKVVLGKFGPCFVIKDEFSSRFGKFIGVAKKEATYQKKGLTSASKKFLAWAKLDNNWNVSIFKIDKYLWDV